MGRDQGFTLRLICYRYMGSLCLASIAVQVPDSLASMFGKKTRGKAFLDHAALRISVSKLLGSDLCWSIRAQLWQSYEQ